MTDLRHRRWPCLQSRHRTVLETFPEFFPMAIAIRQIHPVFLGEVSGVDLRGPLSRDDVSAIEAGMDRYAVLVFHDQNISDDQQIAFTRNFGEIEDAAGGNVTKPDQK